MNTQKKKSEVRSQKSKQLHVSYSKTCMLGSSQTVTFHPNDHGLHCKLTKLNMIGQHYKEPPQTLNTKIQTLRHRRSGDKTGQKEMKLSRRKKKIAVFKFGIVGNGGGPET